MPVALVAVILLALREYLGFGPGGMERIATYPEVIWLITFGFYISRNHSAHGSAHRPPNLDSPRYRRAVGRLRLEPRGRLATGRLNEEYQVKLQSLGGSGGVDQTFRLPKGDVNGLSLSGKGCLTGTPRRWGLTRVPVEVAKGEEIADKTYTLLTLSERRPIPPKAPRA